MTGTGCGLQGMRGYWKGCGRYIIKNIGDHKEGALPSKSKAQHRLMSLAYCYKKGECKLSNFPIGVRKKIQEIAKSMTLKQLRHFAKTKETGLPYRKKKGRR